MSTGATLANTVGGLKRRYDDNFMGVCAWKSGPATAMIKKQKWSGEKACFPIRVGNSPARSRDYTIAATKSENATYGKTTIRQFQCDWVTDYSRATISGVLMAAADDKQGTFYDRFVSQIDGILDATTHSFSTKLFRGGYGLLSTIGASTVLASTTLVLANVEDAVLFEIGMDIQFAQFEASGALRNSGAVLTVTGVDTNLGTLTTNANISTVTGTQLGDAIFASGDRENAASPTRTCLNGFDAWLPVVAPTPGESFNGQDRSNDSRLRGVIIDASPTGQNLSEEEALIRATTEVDRLGGKPKRLYLNPTRFGNLAVQQASRIRTQVNGPGGTGFEGFTVQTNYGEVSVFSDRYCQKDRGYLIQEDTWKTYVLGASTVPMFLMADGNKMLRQAADDGVEIRVGYYAAIGCDAPCKNAVIKFA